jgi:GTP-binding protein
LGLGEPFSISALHGLGIADLLDSVAACLPEAVRVEEDSVAIAIIGRPNAGKSSITNKILGFERTIVSEIPGTTRDAVDSLVEVEGERWTFIDTAGIKRKKGEDLDYYGMVRALRSIDRASICLLLIDSSEGVTEQDQKLADMILSRGSACIIVLNKWDLMDEETIDRLKRQTMRKLRFLDFSPILATSAITGEGLNKIFPMLKTLSESYFRRVKTPQLNRFIRELPVGSLPVKKEVKIKYITQTSTGPPSFVVFVNDPKAAKKIQRYIENKLREAFTFLGTPVIIKFKKK